MDHLAAEKVGDFYNPATGFVHCPRSRGHLKADWAEIPEKDRRRPDVLFFLQRNPGYDQGDELVCLPELSLENQNPLAARIFAAGYERGLAATVAADSLTVCRPRLAPLNPPCASPGACPSAPGGPTRGASEAQPRPH